MLCTPCFFLICVTDGDAQLLNIRQIGGDTPAVLVSSVII